eukprot:CAMPEP_0116907714 /NCGR_PEP_ID=MMETSP0467-20121206/13270_1 /TAXON_ID=283647 /ORGANISM="Mesodinium pulex, Strain SPMC105" /LENGTH=99 /DNA_ID=CAMNT_0004582785 /DNA_START=968 /DNA_END=1267 /DNA_ORIENTATION=+
MKTLTRVCELRNVFMMREQKLKLLVSIVDNFGQFFVPSPLALAIVDFTEANNVFQYDLTIVSRLEEVDIVVRKKNEFVGTRLELWSNIDKELSLGARFD